MGITELLQAYVLWFAMFNPNKRCVYISIKLSVSQDFIRGLLRKYEGMPDYLKVPLLKETTTHLIFANGSEIIALAATKDAGRAARCSLLVIDEAAIQRYADEIWGSAQPSLSTGGRAIINSTALGMGNFFHKTWVESEQGLNGIKAKRLYWNEHPERDKAWYNKQLLELGAKRVAQEVDCSFLQSGWTVFDLEDIREIDDRLQKQIPVFTQTFGADAKLIQYFVYDPTKAYFLGADLSTGRSRDYSSFSLYDHHGKEYACFKGKMSVDVFTDLCLTWCSKFGNAIFAPEVNNVGNGAVLRAQAQGYQRLYYHNPLVKKKGQHNVTQNEDVFPGWNTNGSTRKLIITRFEDDLRAGNIEINNPFMVQEAYTFIYDSNNRPVAMGKGRDNWVNSENSFGDGYTDDALFGEFITNFVRQAPQRHVGGIGY